jgi:RNA polymerase sigma-70 factor (ECF subfamily)
MTDLDSADIDPSLTDRPETPERSYQRRQDQERVYRALEQVAPKKRIVLYLHEIEGLDLKEIAYLVDSNPVTVRTRLFYARREFYKVLAGEPVESDE